LKEQIMSTRHLVDPALPALIEHEFLARPSRTNLAESRAYFSQMMSSITGKSPAVRREVRVPGPVGAPDVRPVIQSPPDAGDALTRAFAAS
jgi:hypothetical protein